LTAAAAQAPAVDRNPPRSFSELTTFDVEGEVAEILAVTPNGRTLLYTDSAEEELGLVDLSQPKQPKQLGTVQVDGEPTSVAVTRGGKYALVAVDTSSSLAPTFRLPDRGRSARPPGRRSTRSGRPA